MCARSLRAAALVVASTGLAACATVKVDDVRFVSMRKVSAQSIPVQGMVRDRLVDDAFVEATLSTSFDVAASANGREPWVPYARRWICDRGWDDNFPQAAHFIFEDGKRVQPIGPRADGSGKVRPDNETSARHIYTVYFPVRAKGRDVDALSPKQTAYDLEFEPADVCVELGTAGYFTVSLKTNVVTIPAQAFETLFKREVR